MANNASLVGRMSSAVKRRGVLVKFRPTSAVTSPGSLPNPAVLSQLVVSGSYPTSTNVISLRAAEAFGRLLPGDVLVIRGARYTVSVAKNSITQPAAGVGGAFTPGFTAVNLTTSIPIGGAVDGDAVSVEWATDISAYVLISAFPFSLVDGTLIKNRDIRVIVGADSITTDPTMWQIILPGEASPQTIINAQPVYFQNMIIQWQMQAR